MDIGQNIKIARKRAQLTQKQLSELSNVAAVTIQQYETGKRQPQIEQLLKLADALHVTLEEILGISSNRFKVPITSDLLQTLDWYARKNNRSLYEEVDIAIDTYLDGLSMQGLLSDEDDSLEMGPPPERYELFFPI